jgi:hypothetical protein
VQQGAGGRNAGVLGDLQTQVIVAWYGRGPLGIPTLLERREAPKRLQSQAGYFVALMSSARCSAVRAKCLRNCSPRRSDSLCGNFSLLAFVPQVTRMCPEA